MADFDTGEVLRELSTSNKMTNPQLQRARPVAAIIYLEKRETT